MSMILVDPRKGALRNTEAARDLLEEQEVHPPLKC